MFYMIIMESMRFEICRGWGVRHMELKKKLKILVLMQHAAAYFMWSNLRYYLWAVKRGEEISRSRILLDANLLCYRLKVKSDLISFLFCVWIIDLCNIPYSPLLALPTVPHYHLVSNTSSPQSLTLHSYRVVRPCSDKSLVLVIFQPRSNLTSNDKGRPWK